MNIPTWLRAAVWAVAGLMAGQAFAADGSADTAATLRQAVRERRVVEFAYNGHSRTVEPHALGRGAEENAVLLGWQTGGRQPVRAAAGLAGFLPRRNQEPEIFRKNLREAPAGLSVAQGGAGADGDHRRDRGRMTAHESQRAA